MSGDNGLNKNWIKQHLSVYICLVIAGLTFYQKNFQFLFFGLGKCFVIVKNWSKSIVWTCTCMLCRKHCLPIALNVSFKCWENYFKIKLHILIMLDLQRTLLLVGLNLIRCVIIISLITLCNVKILFI